MFFSDGFKWSLLKGHSVPKGVTMHRLRATVLGKHSTPKLHLQAWVRNIFLYLRPFFIYCMCLAYGHVFPIAPVWEPKDNLWESVMSFNNVGSEEGTQGDTNAFTHWATLPVQNHFYTKFQIWLSGKYLTDTKSLSLYAYRYVDLYTHINTTLTGFSPPWQLRLNEYTRQILKRATIYL